jgi:hypothetical protein
MNAVSAQNDLFDQSLAIGYNQALSIANPPFFPGVLE